MTKNKQCQYHLWDKKEMECFCTAKHSMVVARGVLESQTEGVVINMRGRDIFRLCDNHFKLMDDVTKYSKEYHSDATYGGKRKTWHEFQSEKHGGTVRTSIRLRRHRL